jgi:hypothetical protein
MDLSPLNIHILNPHGDDDGGILLLWLSPVGRPYFYFLLFLQNYIAVR